MLTLADASMVEKAKRLRWFGIDREGKQNGTWNNDVWEIGYKYQMTDISAAMGIAGLTEWKSIVDHRRTLSQTYAEGLRDVPDIKMIGMDTDDRQSSAWLCTVWVKNRVSLQRKLRDHGIESGQVHYRNDRYTIFQDYRGEFPNMDAIQEHYLVLPLHTWITVSQVERIVAVIRSGW